MAVLAIVNMLGAAVDRRLFFYWPDHGLAH